MKERIEQLVKAGYSGIALVTSEEARAKCEMAAVASAMDYGLLTWDILSGLTTIDGILMGECKGNPGKLFQYLAGYVPADMENITDEDYDKYGSKLIVLLDFHQFLTNAQPVLIRALKDELARGKVLGRTIVFLGCKSNIPPELEKEVAIVDFALPDKEALEAVMRGLCSTNQLEPPENPDAVLTALQGQTTIEAECSMALSLVKTHKLDPRTIWYEKAQIVKKSGVLQFLDTDITFDSVGGYDAAREYYRLRQSAFTDEAKAYGLPSPRGVLVVGVQGGGKSLMGKALGNLLGLPILWGNMGNLRGGIQGQTEANTRLFMQTAEAVAPCILFIDEIEKGMAGYASDHQTTGGTGGRQLQMLLPWMEADNGVYIYATSNDISKLPPELLRKGRFDEIDRTVSLAA